MAVATESGAPTPRGAGIEQHLLHGIDRLAATLGRVTPRSGIRFNPNAAPAHLLTGLRGEEEALFHLRRRGYIIVARRWQTPRLPGDIDLIAWEGETLCFVEVKTRTGRDIVPAEFAVDQHKQQMLRTLACVFLKRFPESTRGRIPVRFDVVAVYLPTPGTVARIEIELFPAAFSR